MEMTEQDFLGKVYEMFDRSADNTDVESRGITAETLRFWRELYTENVDPGKEVFVYDLDEKMLEELVDDELFIVGTEIGRQTAWKALHHDCEPGIWFMVDDDTPLSYDADGSFYEPIRMRCTPEELIADLGFNPNALHTSVAVGKILHVAADDEELCFVPCGEDKATHLFIESRIKAIEAGEEAASVAGDQLLYTGLSVMTQNGLLKSGVLDFFSELPELKRQFMLVPIPENSALSVNVRNCCCEWQKEDKAEREAFKKRAEGIEFEQRMELLDMIDSEFADLQMALESASEQIYGLSEEFSRVYTELIQKTFDDGRCVVIEAPESELYRVQHIQPSITASISELVKALDAQRKERTRLNELSATRSVRKRAWIEFAPRFIELQPVVQELGGLLHVYHANVTLALPDDHEIRTRSYTCSAKGLLACMRDLKQGRKDLYEAEDDIASEMMKLLDSDD